MTESEQLSLRAWADSLDVIPSGEPGATASDLVIDARTSPEWPD